MIWFIVTIVLLAASLVGVYLLGYTRGRHQQLRTQTEAVLEATDGEIPDATVTVHLLSPGRASVNAEAYHPQLKDLPPAASMAMAVAALRNAIEEVGGIKIDEPKSTSPGPYL